MGKEFGETIMGQLSDAAARRAGEENYDLKDAILSDNARFGLASEIEQAAVILRWFHAEMIDGGLGQWEDNGYSGTILDIEELLDSALEDGRSLAVRAVQDILRAWNSRRMHASVRDAFDTCYYAIADDFLDAMDEYFREWFARGLATAGAHN